MRHKLFLVFLALIFINVRTIYAQSLEIGHAPPSPPLGCGEHTGIVTIKNISGAVLSDLSYEINLPAGIFVNRIITGSQNVLLNNEQKFTITDLDLAADETFTVEYGVMYCGYSTAAPLTFNMLNGSPDPADALQVDLTNPDFPVAANPVNNGSLLYSDQDIAINSSVGSIVYREFELINGDINPFNGSFYFSDNFGSSLIVTNVEVFQNGISLGAFPSISGTANSYKILLPLTNVLHNSSVIVRETIQINSCLSSNNVSQITMRWGCANSCTTATDEVFINRQLVPPPIVSLINQEHLLNGTPILLSETSTPFNNVCLGAQNVLHRSYTCSTSVSAASEVYFLLSNNYERLSNGIRTNIPLNSILVTLNTPSGSQQFTPDALSMSSAGVNARVHFFRPQFGGSAITEVSTAASCLESETLVERMPVVIPQLLLGETVTIEWDEVNCCAPDTAFNTANRFRGWTLSGSYRGECSTDGLTTIPATDLLSETPYSTFARAVLSPFKAPINALIGETVTMESQNTQVVINYPYEINNSVVEVRIDLEDGLTMLNTSPVQNAVQIVNAGFPGIVWEPYGMVANAETNTSNADNKINEVRNFQFSVQTLHNLMSANGINVSLQEFLAGSTIRNELQSLCTVDGNSFYVQQMLFYPGNSLGSCLNACPIPLSSVRSQVSIICPGCKIPGPAIIQATFERFSIDIEDVDNDGIVDAGEVVNPSSTLIKRNYATVNDIMEFNLTSVVSDGSDEEAGFEYETFINDPAGRDLDELFLEVRIGNASQKNHVFANGFRLTLAEVTLLRNGVNKGTASVPNLVSLPENGLFLIHFNATDFVDVDSFAPGDVFQFKGQLRISKNVYNDIDLVFANFRSSITDDASAFPSGDVGELAALHPNAYENLSGFINPGQDYWCQGAAGIFRFIPYNSFLSLRSENTSNVCEKKLSVTVLGGHTNGNASNFVYNAFPNEIRDYGKAESYTFEIPPGYSVVNREINHITSFSPLGMALTRDVDVQTAVISASSYPNSQLLNFTTPPGFHVADEVTNSYMELVLSAECKDIQTEYQAFVFGTPSPLPQDGEFRAPAATLTSGDLLQTLLLPPNKGTSFGTGQSFSAPRAGFEVIPEASTLLEIGSSQESFEVRINNLNVNGRFENVTHAYLAFNNLPSGISVIDVHRSSDNLAIPMVAANIFEIGNVPAGTQEERYTFTLAFDCNAAGCDPATLCLDKAPFQLLYGWNCGSVPVTLSELNSTCGTGSIPYRITTELVSMQVVANTVPVGSGCTNLNHTLLVNSTQNGEINSFDATINLPAGLSYDAGAFATLTASSTPGTTITLSSPLITNSGRTLSFASLGSPEFPPLTIGKNYTLSIPLVRSGCISSSDVCTTSVTGQSYCGRSFAVAPVVSTLNTAACTNIPVASIDGPTQVCYAASASLSAVVVSGGVAPFTYQWINTSGNEISGATSATYSTPALTINPSTYAVRITDVNGCSDVSDEYSVVVLDLPVISAGPDMEICSGNSVVLTASGGTSYVWSTGATTALINVTPVTTTTYTVTGTNANACSNTDQVQVIVNANPIVTVSTPVLSCPENSGGTNCQNLTATVSSGTPGYSYLWSTGASTSIVNVCPAANTTYSINVTDSKGCSGSAATSVMVDYEYELSLDPNPYICGDNQQLCVTLNKINGNVDAGIIGMDYAFTYDKTLFSLASNATSVTTNLGPVVTHNDLINYKPGVYLFNQVPAGSNEAVVHLSIYYKAASLPNSQFEGQGRVATVCFNVLNSNVNITPYVFKKWELQEAYTLREKDRCLRPDTFRVQYDTVYRARLFYMNTAKYLGYTGTLYPSNHAQYRRPTDIYKAQDNCDIIPSSIKTPDDLGRFDVILNSNDKIRIQRDIDNTYLPVPGGSTTTNTNNFRFLRYVNGADANYMGRITTFDPLQDNLYSIVSNPTLRPIGLQMIAADVNMNGRVRANDITLTQKRSVALIPEYPQDWNYNPVTNQKIAGLGNSLDWIFIDKKTYDSGNEFKISTNYPYGTDLTGGFFRDSVPSVPFCLSVAHMCKNDPRAAIHGILLGDVIDRADPSTANSAPYPSNGDSKIRTTASAFMKIDLNAAMYMGNNTYQIILEHQVPAEDTLISIDFGMNYDESKIEVVDVISEAGEEINMLWNDYMDDELLLTSYTMERMTSSGSYYSILIRKPNGQTVTREDLGGTLGLLNGYEVDVQISGVTTSVTDGSANTASYVVVIPSPAKGYSKIEYSVKSGNNNNRMVITNTIGQIVREYNNLPESGVVDFDADSLSGGVYICTVYGENVVAKMTRFTVVK